MSNEKITVHTDFADVILDMVKQVYRQKGVAEKESYESWIRRHTDWSHDEFVEWCANGRVPND